MSTTLEAARKSQGGEFSGLAAARLAATLGDDAAVLRILRPLVERGEADAEAMLVYAEAAMNAGRLDGVAEALAQSAERARDVMLNTRLRTKQAQVLLARNRNEEALLAALDAAERAPRDPEVAEVFGHALLRSGRADHAAIVFRDVIEASATPSFRCVVGMIRALADAGHREAALEFGDAFKGQFPNQSVIDLELARVERQLGRYDSARERLLALPTSLRTTIEVLVALGETALGAMRDDEAREWFAKAHKLNPNEPFLRHIAVGDTAPQADEEYVRGLFDSYAARFEQSLLSLGYRVPGLILAALHRHHPALVSGEGLSSVLDLGCGTGLIGVVLHDVIKGRLKGVDLSAGMIDHARKKDIYTELEVAEIVAYLKAERERWQTIIAADVLCYFGDLTEVIDRCFATLEPGGVFVFTVEHERGTETWSKRATGRFGHGRGFIEGLLKAWRVLALDEVVLRMDRGHPVDGLLVVAVRP